MTLILQIASGKGGMGKSTMSANLAAAFAESGHKTVLFDGDYTGNSSRMLDVEPFELHDRGETFAQRWAPYVTDLDFPEPDLGEIAQPTAHHPNLFVISGGPELQKLQKQIAVERPSGWENDLGTALRSMTGGFDRVVIDTRPDTNEMFELALHAADAIVTVVGMADTSGPDGIISFLELYNPLSRRKKVNGKLLGALRTNWDARKLQQKITQEDLEQIDGLHLLEPPIRATTVVPFFAAKKMPYVLGKPDHLVSRDTRQAAAAIDELMVQAAAGKAVA
jgi:chromosome partitioning protein